jgi:hypothetical protein
MFYDTDIDILNPVDLHTVLKTIQGDVQPFFMSISFEDGIIIDITHRAFCEKDQNLTLDSYLRIHDRIYKVIELKSWSDYVTLHLFLCRSDFAEVV